MIYTKSITYTQLSKKIILDICKLKNENWNYGIASNLKWFKKKVKKEDIHNLLFFNKKLIGYTLLRKRLAFIKKKKSHYFYFDTLAIKKKFRKKNYSKILMNTNSQVIVKKKLHSFLICKKKVVKYYKKFGWVPINRKLFKLMDRKLSSNGMIFNYKLKLKNINFQYYRD
jgi:N-acetylglutamate synthase-like GNAT family acetyltransferase